MMLQAQVQDFEQDQATRGVLQVSRHPNERKIHHQSAVLVQDQARYNHMKTSSYTIKLKLDRDISSRCKFKLRHEKDLNRYRRLTR